MPENSTSYPISADDEKVVVDEVEGSGRKLEDLSCDDGYVKNKENVEHWLQPSPQPAFGLSASPARTDRPRRLEDVFQDVIIKVSVKLSDFKRFARSRYGLRLSNYDVDTICQDNNSVEEKKMQMLNKWKQKMGKNATFEKILQILEDYMKKINEEEELTTSYPISADDEKVDVDSGILKDELSHKEVLMKHPTNEEDASTSEISQTSVTREAIENVDQQLKATAVFSEDEISPEGGHIHIPGCKLTFDKGSFEKTATVKTKLGFDIAKCPFECMAIGPFLDCDISEPLLKPVQVELDIICMSNKPDKVQFVHILHQSVGSHEWEIVDKKSLSKSPSVTFSCRKFSPLFPAILQNDYDMLRQHFSYPVDGYLSASEDSNFHLTFFCSSKVLEKTVNCSDQKHYKLGSFITGYGDVLATTLYLENPGNFYFVPELDFSLVINNEFIGAKQVSQNTALVCSLETQPSCSLILRCAVTHNERPCSVEPHGFNHYWKQPAISVKKVKIVVEKLEDLSCDDGNVKNKATDEHRPQPSAQPAPGPSASPARTDRPRRLEDVFQDVIIKAFVKLADFKRFARSRYGLRLSNYDVETICEDYSGAEEKKMQMLNKWKQKMGRNATPEKILQILEDYLKKMNEEDD